EVIGSDHDVITILAIENVTLHCEIRADVTIGNGLAHVDRDIGENPIVARAAFQEVAVCASFEEVVSLPSTEQVSTGPALDPVVAAEPVDDVVPGGREN